YTLSRWLSTESLPTAYGPLMLNRPALLTGGMASNLSRRRADGSAGRTVHSETRCPHSRPDRAFRARPMRTSTGPNGHQARGLLMSIRLLRYGTVRAAIRRRIGRLRRSAGEAGMT